jgi:hypothetical protein
MFGVAGGAAFQHHRHHNAEAEIEGRWQWSATPLMTMAATVGQPSAIDRYHASRGTRGRKHAMFGVRPRRRIGSSKWMDVYIVLNGSVHLHLLKLACPLHLYTQVDSDSPPYLSDFHPRQIIGGTKFILPGTFSLWRLPSRFSACSWWLLGWRSSRAPARAANGRSPNNMGEV